MPAAVVDGWRIPDAHEPTTAARPLPVMQAPDGLMLLHHLSAMHPDEVGPYLDHMRTEDPATVAAEAYEVIEEDEMP